MDLNHLVGGAVYGATFAFVAIAAPRFTRHLLAAVLVVAALCYVAFAIAAHAGAGWIALELVGAGIYGYAAMRGVRGSAWWLVAGLALHPIWDVALRLAGAASAFAPEWYATSCPTFDLAVAAVAAIAILIGTHLTDVPASESPRRVASPLRPSSCTCAACCTMGACAA
jgi:hypothetical protein